MGNGQTYSGSLIFSALLYFFKRKSHWINEFQSPSVVEWLKIYIQQSWNVEQNVFWWIIASEAKTTFSNQSTLVYYIFLLSSTVSSSSSHWSEFVGVLKNLWGKKKSFELICKQKSRCWPTEMWRTKKSLFNDIHHRICFKILIFL